MCLTSGGRGASLCPSCVILPPCPTSGAAFRAPFSNHLTQGLKPLAEPYCPFGTKSDAGLTKRRVESNPLRSQRRRRTRRTLSAFRARSCFRSRLCFRGRRCFRTWSLFRAWRRFGRCRIFRTWTRFRRRRTFWTWRRNCRRRCDFRGR
jgi:hypothetical protein